MNEPNESHNTNGQAESVCSTDGEAQDRLVEQGLREVLGDEAPPDLSERILTAVSNDNHQTEANRDRKSIRYGKKRLLGLATLAASVLVLGAFLLTAGDGRWLLSLDSQPRPDGPSGSVNYVPNESRQGTVAAGSHRPTESDFDSGAVVGGVVVATDGSTSGGYGGGGFGGGEVAPSVRSDWGISREALPRITVSSGLEEPASEVGGTTPASASGRRPVTGNDVDVRYALSQVREEKGITRETILNGPTHGAKLGEAKTVVVGNSEFADFGRAAGARGRSDGDHPSYGNISFFNSQQEWQFKTKYKIRFDQDERFRHAWEPPKLGDRYASIHDNPFTTTQGTDAVSTFSIDVDTASYANVRQFILRDNRLPPPGAVRIEELVNYFSYDYAPPEENDKAPFAAHVEVAGCPWQPDHRLVRIGLKGRVVETNKRPLSNLVFLVDVSGSMNEANKLPLVVDGLKHMTRRLGENDRVAIVVYASSEGLALPSTLGTDQATILAALDNLRAGGSTAGGAGIQLAYHIAEDNFIRGGINRVILCTDGDFNVGVTDTDELQRLAERKAHETNVFLTVLGFGRGNLNDEMMEAISNKGNGNYHYVDSFREARRVLVDQMSGTLVTIAKDVKIQVEFNPGKVARYRLIGYENRVLAREDFDDDTKDAGEIGAGHAVTAIYEVRPAGRKTAPRPGSTEPLKYQKPAASVPAPAELTDAADSNELLTLRLRYKPPTGDTSEKLELPVHDSKKSYTEASDDFQFAAAVASFGMLMRHSEHAGNASLDSVLELAEQGLGDDPHGYRTEFIEIVRKAKSL